MKRMPIYAPLDLVTPLQFMLRDLRDHRLEVVKAAAPQPKHAGHGIRVVNGQNPKWYQDLCLKHTSIRKNKRKRIGKKQHDTKVKRGGIFNALRGLCSGTGTYSPYAFDLLCIARDLQWEWEEESRERRSN